MSGSQFGSGGYFLGSGSCVGLAILYIDLLGLLVRWLVSSRKVPTCVNLGKWNARPNLLSDGGKSREDGLGNFLSNTMEPPR